MIFKVRWESFEKRFEGGFEGVEDGLLGIASDVRKLIAVSTPLFTHNLLVD